MGWFLKLFWSISHKYVETHSHVVGNSQSEKLQLEIQMEEFNDLRIDSLFGRNFYHKVLLTAAG